MASLSDPAQQDRRPSPIGVNLPQSNNPFRNPRTASPATLSPAFPSPAGAPALSPRLSPTNPFLAAHEVSSAQQPTANASATMAQSTAQTQQTSPTTVDKDTAQLFHRLTLLDSDIPKDAPLTKTATNNSLNGIPPGGHKPSRSDEAERRRDPRMRPRPRPNGPKQELDIFASPEKRERRPRRNSESSVMSKSSMTEEERRRRERRRREQAERGSGSKERRGSKERKSSKDRSGSKHRTRRKPRGMDLIDQLDQTGIYGAGFFHHDGPFDAVNPHRNRRKDGRAPMQAFPAGSANMMLGGSGPLNKNIDLERFHGRGAEGFTDFAAAPVDDTKKKSVLSFDPLARVDPVHGEETYGLGTSTFLDGAPASRRAIEQRESETQAEILSGGGLQRKKSLAQRIRGMSRREYEAGERPMIRGYANGPMSPNSPGAPLAERQVQSAGGPSKSTNDPNPFDTMYDDAFDKKGAAIKVAEQEREADKDLPKVGRARAPSSPQNPLERKTTADSANDDTENKRTVGSGFLNRVKSMRGGRGGRHGRSGS